MKREEGESLPGHPRVFVRSNFVSFAARALRLVRCLDLFLSTHPPSAHRQQTKEEKREKHRKQSRACLDTMLRRSLGTSLVKSASAAPCTALVAVQRRTVMEPMSVWWLASWSMMWHYNFLTMFPLMAAELLKPGLVYNKVAMLHFFHDKKQEAKLRRVLDDTVTTWSDELDTAAIDDAISRGF